MKSERWKAETRKVAHAKQGVLSSVGPRSVGWRKEAILTRYGGISRKKRCSGNLSVIKRRTISVRLFKLQPIPVAYKTGMAVGLVELSVYLMTAFNSPFAYLPAMLSSATGLILAA